MDVGEHSGTERCAVRLVVVRQKLVLQFRHVHVRWTLGLHPLHSRQRSRVSYRSLPVKSSAGSFPERISRIRLARPRVECLSSSVTMYEGHIVPSFFFRQTPT